MDFTRANATTYSFNAIDEGERILIMLLFTVLFSYWAGWPFGVLELIANFEQDFGCCRTHFTNS